MKKKLAFVIKTSQDFLRYNNVNLEQLAPEYNTLFETISNVYIPLLNLVEKLEEENIDCRFSLVLPPVLCTLLESEVVQDMYISWIEKCNQLGNLEIQRNSENKAIVELIQSQIKKNSELKEDFEVKYQKKLVKKFADFHQKGFIELLATCGTDIFIPHYADLPEVISAQIETGLQAFRQSFGCFPDGFWLPELGYTTGVEKIIRAYGYSYTILDARSVLLSEQLPSKGIFYPSRTENSLGIFTNSPDVNNLIFGEEGYSNNPVYKNGNRDIGFELPLESLADVIKAGMPRFSTGYKYWNKNNEDEEAEIYNQAEAKTQIISDARNFLENRNELLSKVAELMPEEDYVVSVISLDATELQQKWCEWIDWFEEVLRNAKSNSLVTVKFNEMLDKQFTLEKISPYYSSSAGDGYGENLLSSKNCWMMRYARKASERMIDLADRFPNDTGLKTRLLNLGAKELLIAQSSSLAKMIENNEFTEFAEKRFKESISAFTSVFDSLGSNTVSTEWLTTLEEKDNLFPWMNYRIFSKKK